MQPTGQISPDGYWMWNGTQWVPNPYRQAAAPPVTAPYESARSRAGVATVLIGSNIAGVLLLTATYLAIDLVPQANDQQSLVIGLLALLAAVVWLGTLAGAAVFFSMWLHRVVRNMPALGAADPRWSPARAVTYCFIPIVWFFHPLFSVLDTWRGSDTSRRWIDRASRRAIRPPALIVWWWVTWLVGSYAFNISSRINGGVAVALDVVGGVCGCAAAILCIRVVREVTARQERKNQLISSGQLV